MAVRVAALTFVAVVAGGCPYVPDADLDLIAGELPVEPGATLIFRFQCQYLFDDWETVAGPGKCGASWFVNDVPGGTPETGTITSCGEYTAPRVRPAEPPMIVVWDSDWGWECSDCCAAGITLSLDGYR